VLQLVLGCPALAWREINHTQSLQVINARSEGRPLAVCLGAVKLG
jgi:hypothetical protein